MCAESWGQGKIFFSYVTSKSSFSFSWHLLRFVYCSSTESTRNCSPYVTLEYCYLFCVLDLAVDFAPYSMTPWLFSSSKEAILKSRLAIGESPLNFCTLKYPSSAPSLGHSTFIEMDSCHFLNLTWNLNAEKKASLPRFAVFTYL